MPYTDSKLGLNIYVYGETGSPVGVGKGVQSFVELVEKARKTGTKFEDPVFPATQESLRTEPFTWHEDGSLMDIQWKRPTEIAKELFNAPPVFAKTYDQFGVKQGMEADCWLLSVIADVATKPEVINTLIPADNKNDGFATGVFHFRLWNRGKWVDVPVDDRLACIMTKEGKIQETVMSAPTAEGGFWAPLLEKAYAKMYGKYEYIGLGYAVDAMQDFTGGIPLEYAVELELQGDKYKEKILDGLKWDALMAAGTGNIPADWTVPPSGDNPGDESVSKDGIAGLHAYSVLDLRDVTDQNDVTTTLVKCRNPWGNKVEWSGAFSDKDDSSWESVGEDLRTGVSDDGQFWIPIEDLRRYNIKLYTCLWKGAYRGDKTVKLPEGLCYFANGTFPQANSGECDDRGTFVGKVGY